VLPVVLLLPTQSYLILYLQSNQPTPDLSQCINQLVVAVFQPLELADETFLNLLISEC
jgi:hypothetical protein